MSFEWSFDYCLACDREAPNGAAYCSQACRAVDLERASYSPSSSPKDPSSADASTGARAPAPGGFYLPPAFNFSALSGRPSAHEAVGPTGESPILSTPRWTNARKGSVASNLHPSPSRTSLSSMPSQHSSFEQSYLSAKAVRELNDYANSFDQVRDNKRRMTIY